ncbi:MAG: hypothetical protein HC785_08490 [Calothrix sp. CSU_2_0]|nr:hypothetical protein [Calothrix sp. CSU_2_0]
MNQNSREISSLTVAYYVCGFNIACEILAQNTGLTRQHWADWVAELTEKELESATQQDIDDYVFAAIAYQNKAPDEPD